MIQTLIDQARESFQDYVQQLRSINEYVTEIEIESFFEGIQYRDLVDLYRKHNADDATIAGYVRAFNDLVEYQLNLYHFQEELNILLERPLQEQKRKLPILKNSIMAWIESNPSTLNDSEVIDLLHRLEPLQSSDEQPTNKIISFPTK